MAEISLTSDEQSNDATLEAIQRKAMQEVDDRRRENDAAMLKMRWAAEEQADALYKRYVQRSGGRMMYLPRPR